MNKVRVKLTDGTRLEGKVDTGFLDLRYLQGGILLNDVFVSESNKSGTVLLAKEVFVILSNILYLIPEEE